MLFFPALQIFALALPHPFCPAKELPYFCTGFFIKFQYVTKISKNKSLEEGEQEISTLQTILKQSELAG